MPPILALVPDLMFATRIEDAAKHLGYSIHSLTPGENSDAVMTRVSPALVVVSLDAAEWLEVVQAAKRAGARVLAFGSHRNVQVMLAAKSAGCDEVVARSRLASELPQLLKKWGQGTED